MRALWKIVFVAVALCLISVQYLKIALPSMQLSRHAIVRAVDLNLSDIIIYRAYVDWRQLSSPILRILAIAKCVENPQMNRCDFT